MNFKEVLLEMIAKMWVNITEYKDYLQKPPREKEHIWSTTT